MILYLLYFVALSGIFTLAMFLVAKIVGVPVTTFGLFLHPFFKVFERRIGNTDFILGWLPFGSYLGFGDHEHEGAKQYGLPESTEGGIFTYPASKQYPILMAGPFSMLIIGIILLFSLGENTSLQEALIPLGIIILFSILFIALGFLGKRKAGNGMDEETSWASFIIGIILQCGLWIGLLLTLDNCIELIDPFLNYLNSDKGYFEIWKTPVQEDWAYFLPAGAFAMCLINLFPLAQSLNGNALIHSWYTNLSGKKINNTILEAGTIIFGIGFLICMAWILIKFIW